MDKDKKSFISRPETLAVTVVLIFFVCSFVSAAINYFAVANEWKKSDKSEYPKTEEYVASIKKSSLNVAQELYAIDFKKIAAKASSVFIKGDFNGWEEEELTKNKDGEWAIRKKLAPGDYRFIYVVDGKEQLDDFKESKNADYNLKKSKGINTNKVSFVSVKKH